MNLEVRFNEQELFAAGRASRTGGYGAVVQELFADAAKTRGRWHLFPHDVDGRTAYQLPGHYDQEIFDHLAAVQHLLGSELVKTAELTVENPAEPVVEAILSGLAELTLLSRLHASWNYDILQRRFPAVREWWEDSFNDFLGGLHEEKPLRLVSMGFYYAWKREVIFNPYNGPDCLTMNGPGLDPSCGEFIATIGYPMSSLHVVMAATERALG